MKRFDQLREDELLVLIMRAAEALELRTDYVNDDDYEPWDSSDQTHWMNRFAEKTLLDATDWLWSRHGMRAENHIQIDGIEVH